MPASAAHPDTGPCRCGRDRRSGAIRMGEEWNEIKERCQPSGDVGQKQGSCLPYRHKRRIVQHLLNPTLKIHTQRRQRHDRRGCLPGRTHRQRTEAFRAA